MNKEKNNATLVGTTIEIITTGTEVLTGEIINSNVSWLAQQCGNLGLNVTRHTTVGDGASEIAAACRAAINNANVVIVTGGLGATTDDITLSAAADAFGLQLELHEDLWLAIQELYAKRGRECTPNNKRMAMIPAGAALLSNPVGTAHAVRLTVNETTFFFLPGVPQEMEAIFSGQITEWLKSNSTSEVAGLRVLRCFDRPEATLGQSIEALQLPSEISVGYRVIYPETLIKLMGKLNPAEPVSKLNEILDQTEAKVRAVLGDAVIGNGESTIANVVAACLQKRKETIAVAESCSGGALSQMITANEGASAYFLQGVVCYSNASKIKLLGVPEELLEEHGAVSLPVAAVLANNVRELSSSTYGIGITGIAGPGGGTTDKPVGTVFVALSIKNIPTQVEKFHLPVGRERFQRYVSLKALNMLRKVIA